MDLLKNVVDMLPDALPYSAVIKSFTRALANESQGNSRAQFFLTQSGHLQPSLSKRSIMMRNAHLLVKLK